MRYAIVAMIAVLLAGCANGGAGVFERAGILREHGDHPILSGELHGTTFAQANAVLDAPVGEVPYPDGSVCLIYAISEAYPGWVSFAPNGATTGYGLGAGCGA